MVTKLEVNIRSLLSNCEELSKDETNFWRLKKYIKSLDTMIEELRETTEDLTQKALSDYHSRLQQLKNITNYVDSPRVGKKFSSNIKQKDPGDDLIKEVNQLQNSKIHFELKQELLGDSSIRRRNPKTDENMDQAMKYYSDAQERITEDMLALTRSLKEQTQTANKIIRKDTEVVSKSTQMSDANINSLAKEAEKLQDHSRKAWKCWMWIMIGLVMVIFLFMVFFMKIMKKKTS